MPQPSLESCPSSGATPAQSRLHRPALLALALLISACGSSTPQPPLTITPASTTTSTTVTTTTPPTTVTAPEEESLPSPVEEPGPLSFAAPDETQLMKHVRSLTAPELQGRLTGSAGARLAADVIIEQLESCVGIEPVAGSGFRLAAGVNSLPPGWTTEVVNIAAQWPGSGSLASEVVLLSAHYDHLGPTVDGVGYFPGAVDNAGAVATLLSLACSTPSAVDDQPRRAVVFAFFDAEEAGLLGSKAWVSNPPLPTESISAHLNLDGFGAPLLDHLRSGVAIGADLSSGLADEIAAANEADGAYRMMPVGHQVLAGRGDQAPFQERGVVSIHLATGIPPGIYHTPADTSDVVDPSLLADATRWTGRLTMSLAARPGPLTRTEPPRTPYAAASSILAVIETLEAHPSDVLGPEPNPDDLKALSDALSLARLILDPWLSSEPVSESEWVEFNAAMALISSSFAELLV